MHTTFEKKLLFLRPDDILPSPDRVRKTFSEYSLYSLAKSITQNGVIEPLCVRKGGRDKYILICGERRLRAAKIAGIRRVPCVLYNTDERSAAMMTLSENFHREQPDFFSEAVAIDRIIGIYGMANSDMALCLGIQKEALSERLKLLKISPLDRERILAASLSKRHAQALTLLPAGDIPDVLDAVINGNLSERETEELVNSILFPPKSRIIEVRPVHKSVIGDIKFFSNSLSKLLGVMQNSGVQTSLSKNETKDYACFEIRIEKNTVHQLSFTGV